MTDDAPFELSDNDHAEFAALARQCDEPPSELYIETVTAMRLLTAHGGQPTMDEIGAQAWASLTVEQRAEALPRLLGCWATTVVFEESELSRDEIAAAQETTGTGLTEWDIASAWDSVATHGGAAPGDDEVVLERDLVVRLLDEVTLLRRRVDTTPTEAAQ